MKLTEVQLKRIVLSKQYIVNPSLSFVKKVVKWAQRLEKYHFVVLSDYTVIENSEVNGSSFISLFSLAREQNKRCVLWLSGAYWSDEPSTLTLYITKGEGKRIEPMDKIVLSF